MQAQEQITRTTTTNAEEKPEGLTDEDVLAQCLFFFFAGFETISITLCFATYELCMNPLVQSKLFEEISDMQNHLEGKPLDYNDLNKMDYLDMVVSETLRKWPTAIATDRECAKDYDLRDENDEVVLSLRKGEVVQIPIFALHHDPENFPEPQEFRPERFSDEHNSEIKPYTYLPFGLGPRSCIGNRLAVMELKLMIYNLVLDYNLLPATKTVTNMLQSIVGFRLQPKELFWLKCVPRKTN
ncbi:probable cytochrome P450 9h1 isoform X2 [Scaptodrosophila lebanonensis]|nr:probable cytochrome P450 9h1 isoform X2 [Scaptodrosophila lebanonensis]